MNTVVAIIPARSGSKGVPNKNVKLLGGHPLIAFSIAAAKKTRGIDRVIVSTNSREYGDIAARYGAEVPFLRPDHLAEDSSPDYGVMRHALDWLIQHDGETPEFIVHLRPTTPLRDPAVIDAALETFRYRAEYTALRSIHKMSETAFKCFELHNKVLKMIGEDTFDIEASNRPRQSFPDTYQANGYVDVLRSELILSQGKMHGSFVFGYETPHSAEVDTMDDFQWLKHVVHKEDKLLIKLFQE